MPRSGRSGSVASRRLVSSAYILGILNLPRTRSWPYVRDTCSAVGTSIKGQVAVQSYMFSAHEMRTSAWVTFEYYQWAQKVYVHLEKSTVDGVHLDLCLVEVPSSGGPKVIMQSTHVPADKITQLFTYCMQSSSSSMSSTSGHPAQSGYNTYNISRSASYTSHASSPTSTISGSIAPVGYDALGHVRAPNLTTSGEASVQQTRYATYNLHLTPGTPEVPAYESERTKIVIKNVDDKLPAKDVRSKLISVGPLVCTVEKSHGRAMIADYGSHAAAKSAMARLEGAKLGRRQLSVCWAKEGTDNREAQQSRHAKPLYSNTMPAATERLSTASEASQMAAQLARGRTPAIANGSLTRR